MGQPLSPSVVQSCGKAGSLKESPGNGGGVVGETAKPKCATLPLLSNPWRRERGEHATVPALCRD